jgi:hypothetical protein
MNARERHPRRMGHARAVRHARVPAAARLWAAAPRRQLVSAPRGLGG